MTLRQSAGWEIVALAVLAICYLLLLAEPLPADIAEVVNLIGPVAFGGILGLGVYRLLRQSSWTLLMPALWFRIALTVYFGFGGFFAAVANTETREYMRALFPYDDDMLLRLGLLNAVGTFWAILGLALADFVGMQVGRHRRAPTGGSRATLLERDGSSRPYERSWAAVGGTLAGRNAAPWSILSDPTAHRVASLWLAIGLGWRVLVDLPNQFGLVELVVPGSLGVIGLARLAGYALLLGDSSPARRPGRVLVWGVWSLDLVLGLATFEKTDTLMLALPAVLAMALRGISMLRLVLVGLGLFAAYAAVRPLVEYGREQVYVRYGSLQGAGLGERLGWVAEFLGGARTRAEANADAWSWLARFSYANAQAFVVDRYDRGSPGESGSLEYLATLLVPRVFWKDKPIVSDVGSDLYTLATGQYGTSIAPGVFAEAYWNGGWLSVCLWSLYMGIVVGGFGQFAVRCLARARVWQFPVVLSAVLLATRPDGWFGLTYVGGALTLALLAMAANFVERVVGRPRPAREAIEPSRQRATGKREIVPA